MFPRSASSFQKFSQSRDTYASLHFMPSSMRQHSPKIYFLLYLHTISTKTWNKCKMRGNMNQSSSISVTAKTVLSFVLVFLKETKGKRTHADEKLPFKKLWGRFSYFCCAFVPAFHSLRISCDIILNIFSVIIMIMLDIFVMRHYIHKQPHSTICNTKYIVSKSSTLHEKPKIRIREIT